MEAFVMAAVAFSLGYAFGHLHGYRRGAAHALAAAARSVALGVHTISEVVKRMEKTNGATRWRGQERRRS